MARGVHFDLELPLQLVKPCVGTLSLDQPDDQFGLNCNEVSGPFCVVQMLTSGLWSMLWTDDLVPHPGQRKALLPRPLPPPSPRSPALALRPLEQCFCNVVPTGN